MNPNRCRSFECIGFRPGGRVYYWYASPALQAPAGLDYAVGAMGDVDGDTLTGSFSYQSDTGNTGAGVIADGISACVAGLPPNNLLNCTPTQY